MIFKIFLIVGVVLFHLKADERKWQSQIQEKLNFINFGAQTSFVPSSNTLIFEKEDRVFTFKDVMKNQTLQPQHQRIANFINQIYYSTKFNFDFCKHLYVQSGKILRKINIERSAKRSQNARVRLIFVGFNY